MRFPRRISVLAGVGALLVMALPALASSYTAHLESQKVDCGVVDMAIASIPHGDGLAPVTEEETGPGGWRFNTAGRSFVTFNYELNDDGDGYDVVAGRSNTGSNAGIINDYPSSLDLPQSPRAGAEVFKGRHGVIILGGGDLFQLPGEGNGSVRINVHDPDGDGIYEGCAKSPQITNFGFTVQEGGDFVQQEYFKGWAEVDDDGTVLSFEWTEISTFNNTSDGF